MFIYHIGKSYWQGPLLLKGRTLLHDWWKYQLVHFCVTFYVSLQILTSLVSYSSLWGLSVGTGGLHTGVS